MSPTLHHLPNFIPDTFPYAHDQGESGSEHQDRGRKEQVGESQSSKIAAARFAFVTDATCILKLNCLKDVRSPRHLQLLPDPLRDQLGHHPVLLQLPEVVVEYSGELGVLCEGDQRRVARVAVAALHAF